MDLKESILAAYEADPGFNREEFARDHKCSASYVYRVFRKQKLRELVSWEETIEDTTISRDEKDNTQFIHCNSLTINTLEDALKAADVDMNKWRVDRHTISSSQVTMKLRVHKSNDADGIPIITDEPKTYANWHVKVWLKLNEARHAHEAIIKLCSTLPKFPHSEFKPINYGKRSGYAAIMAIIDAHLGKFAWGEEVGRDYDMKIARDDYLYCTRENLSYMQPFNPEIIYYILGQDLLHVENYESKTPKGGNILDSDNRLPKIIYRAIEIVLKSITQCRQVAPVEVIWVPGNHDIVSSLWMAHVVDQHFKDDEYVKVDLSPAHRKARLWGTTLIGWTHALVGRHQSWANELAQAFPDEWAASKHGHREWQHGHKHKKGEVKTFPIVTNGGVLMRQLTALSPIDAWHFENLFTDAVPGGEAFIMHKTKGMVANFTSWTAPTHVK